MIKNNLKRFTAVLVLILTVSIVFAIVPDPKTKKKVTTTTTTTTTTQKKPATTTQKKQTTPTQKKSSPSVKINTTTKNNYSSNPSSSSYQSVMTIYIGNVSFRMIRVEGKGSPFYIGETEVTQELWQEVMGSNPSYFKGALRPVEQVSWNDCQEFIRKLNQRTGKFFRLPKEEEWEYAAKGGNKSRGYDFSGCNSESELDLYAWYDKNAYYCGSSSQNSKHPDYGTHSVKTKRPNELGIYDMTGNVFEWCEDLYFSWGTIRVERGGAWEHGAKGCRVEYRGSGEPSQVDSVTGLRLAL